MKKKERILAFLISDISNSSYPKAKEHLFELSRKFKKETKEIQFKNLNLVFCFDGKKLPVEQTLESIAFSLGTDRFLHINIENDSIAVKNDYAGTIPLFYSFKSGIVLSNIEPATVLGSGSQEGDISLENLYGFLRFSHFIWDETMWKHIFAMEPDSEYKFDIKNKTVLKKYLASVNNSNLNSTKTNDEIAKIFKDLNQRLVEESFDEDDQIHLPLSAGYDSRLIACALSDSKFKKNVECFSYGPRGSIEVEGGKRVADSLGLAWRNIPVGDNFLRQENLEKIGSVFGSSMHFHGMYQIETTLNAGLPKSDQSILTSGFMTGVPAGQHISLLNITESEPKLLDHMGRFSQSKVWGKQGENILELSTLFQQSFEKTAEERFRKAFDRFDGTIHQKSVMFDIWTRQRNFISYHPRTVEWFLPFISPHMKLDYIDFFMSLSEAHLRDRKAIEIMFQKYYPKTAGVISNSNGIKTLGFSRDTFFIYYGKILRKLGREDLIPLEYKNKRVDFDTPAILKRDKSALWPLFETYQKSAHFNNIVQKDVVEKIFKDLASQKNALLYTGLLELQALAYSINLIA